MLLFVTVCVGQSKDTLCFPTETIRKVLIDAEKGKVYKEQVGLLNQRVSLLQSQIKELQEKDSANTVTSREQISALLQEQTLCQDQVKTMETILRREKRKRKLITAAGILTTGAAIYLSTLK